ncbi:MULTISPECIES: hypothetical protein [Flavobacterium]|uniref:Lipoprotein n=1 Tax=Flavobacterium jumunjinense TaxID=998845 RepID=A0ABV5GTW7_9FLAO|nr:MULTISPECIES: hypothetical protein [Flavobacterium]
MKSIKLTALLITLFAFTTSCNQEPLPDLLIENTQGYNKLTDYIYSHYPNLKDSIEVLDFSYSAGLESPDRTDKYSDMNISFVHGKDKNTIVNYSINNTGKLNNAIIDISVGDILNKKLSNNYETYEPYLFSAKSIDFKVINEVILKSITLFKADTNVEKYFCSAVSIEKEDENLVLSITINEEKQVSGIHKTYDWSIDGKNQIK